MEIWKDIEGYEGLYQVSNLGNVKNNKNKIMKLAKEKNGYLRINLSKNGFKKRMSIHKLVAMTFIPNPNNYPQINHKDENKQNNCVDNLEWCTQIYNINYGNATKKHSKRVKCIETGIIYNSTRDAERKTNIAHNYISKCCLKRKYYKTAGGYHWCYI